MADVCGRFEPVLEGFYRIGMKFVVGCVKTISPACRVLSFLPDDFSVLFLINQPAFRSFQYGNLVAFEAATAAEDQFATVNDAFFEPVNHVFFLPETSKRTRNQYSLIFAEKAFRHDHLDRKNSQIFFTCGKNGISRSFP